MCLAVPGKILFMDHDEQGYARGRIDFGGVLKEINLAYVPEAKVGDYAIVHVGFAISLVDEEEAKKVFGYLKKIGELGELQAESQGEDPR